MSHDKNVHDKKMHDKKSYDKKENENIIEFISTKTGLNKAAFEVLNINEIPKNEAGKTLYKELKV